jgi:hypothetical protein
VFCPPKPLFIGHFVIPLEQRLRKNAAGFTTLTMHSGCAVITKLAKATQISLRPEDMHRFATSLSDTNPQAYLEWHLTHEPPFLGVAVVLGDARASPASRDAPYDADDATK